MTSMRIRFAFVTLSSIAVARALSAQAGPARTATIVAPSVEISQAVAAVAARFDRALAQRDRAALETITASPFTWVHASDGRVDSREVWLTAAARGMALTGQRTRRTEHGATLAAYGEPQPHTVLRVARVQLVDSAGGRESWLRQTTVFVRGDDGTWRIASGQGTLMYEGPRLDPALHARYVGTYDVPDGRVLLLAWEEGALFATLPNGAKAQVFLGSPTEEVVRTLGSGHLRFTLDRDGNPLTAALVRGDLELWRATKRSR